MKQFLRNTGINNWPSVSYITVIVQVLISFHSKICPKCPFFCTIDQSCLSVFQRAPIYTSQKGEKLFLIKPLAK
jgi:hypothetical protein